MRGVIRRLRWLTHRRPVALVALPGLAAGAVAAAAVEQLALATALVGLLVMLVFLALRRVRHRLSADVHAVQLEVRRSRQSIVKGIQSEIVKEIQSKAADQALVTERLEAAHRRILAAVENERLAASDRRRELLAKIDQSIRSMSRLQRDAATHRLDQTREVEALLQLYRDFRPRAPMPPSGRWALNASGLLELLFLVEQHQPKLVLELGSGTSSVWIGYALERIGGHLISIDHAADFAERTRTMLSWHGLGHVAEVRHAPLQTLQVNGEDYRWYAEEAFTDLGEVSLLVVDGPPGSTGPGARFPALHVLETRLSTTATIFLDDADRPDEREIVRQWTETFPGLVRGRGIVDRHAVLTYSRY